MSHPQAGQQAPHFEGLNQKGAQISLADFAGQKLVLYFYPKDDTPGCTAEACSLRDHYDVFLSKGLRVVGISTDNVKSHDKFVNKFSLPFDLIADEDQTIVNNYGVWIEKSMYGRKYMGTNRVTFLIDEQGIIQHVIEKVDTKAHAEQVLKTAGW